MMQSADTLLKFRISVYSIALVHLAVMAPRLLTKNFESDIHMRNYTTLKWKLMTSWFNFMTMAYIPLSLYCDWCTLKRKQRKYVKIFNEIRTFMFTNLVFPVTAFGDILFWRLYILNKDFLMPLTADKFLSLWEHHSMHTVSLIFVIFDLLMVHRDRPKNMIPGMLTLLIFAMIYTCVCAYTMMNGQYVYPIFNMFKGHKLIVLALYCYITLFFYHSGQWIVIDIIHGQKYISKKVV